jgi:hypothetical protein
VGLECGFSRDSMCHGGDIVGSESDRHIQIQNSGSTADNGSCSYALCSRISWLPIFKERRIVVSTHKISQAKIKLTSAENAEY